MRKAQIKGIDSWMGPAGVERSLTKALGAEDVAINYYELDPGESFAFGYHRHEGQEEVFCVLEGEATFETGEPRSGSGSTSGETASEDDETTVGAGEAVRFGPGEWQQGWNRGNERVKALAPGPHRRAAKRPSSGSVRTVTSGPDRTSSVRRTTTRSSRCVSTAGPKPAGSLEPAATRPAAPPSLAGETGRCDQPIRGVWRR